MKKKLLIILILVLVALIFYFHYNIYYSVKSQISRQYFQKLDASNFQSVILLESGAIAVMSLTVIGLISWYFIKLYRQAAIADDKVKYFEKLNLLYKENAESEKKYKLLFDNNPIPMWVYDSDSLRFLLVNDSALEQYGYSRQEFLSMNLLDIRPPEELEKFNKVRSHKSDKVNIFNTLVHKKKDGSLIHVEITSHLIPEKNGIKTRLVMAQDVSEKYKLNEDLILSEKKFRELVENAAYGIYFADNEGKIIFANSKVCEMLGYTIEETLNLTVFDTYLPEEIDSGKLRSKMVSTGEHLKFSRKMLRKDGSTIDVEIGVSRMADGTALGIAQDITKRLRTEEALKESEERFKEIADLLPQTLFETDLRGNLKYVNHAGRIIFGFNNEDDAKKINIYNLLKVDDLIKAKENFNQIFSGGNRKGIEYSAHRKDGSEISIVVYSIPIIRKGAITGLRGLVIDNNERKEYEKQIIMAKEKAEEMNILKTNFLANMSHELRTPMIGILGFSDALTMELQDDDMRDMAETIHFSAERLMNTLNQLLDLSRIEANKADIKLEVLNIVDCLGNIIKTFDLAAKKRKLYLNYEIIDDGIFANLDKIMFEQVINNLINNAVKFTDKGGITVQVMKGVIDSINCSIIKVKDTGIGIEKENQNKIFEEFRQASEGISRKYEGTGLGLTITKKSLELMNGRISVESQPGVGSVFTISFPEYFSSLEKGIE